MLLQHGIYLLMISSVGVFMLSEKGSVEVLMRTKNNFTEVKFYEEQKTIGNFVIRTDACNGYGLFKRM